MDIYNRLWDIDLKENMYLIFQFLERKPTVTNPTAGAITRTLIEDEYDLIGYATFKINNPDGTIRYGTNILDLYEGPIFVEELDPLKKTFK